MTCSGVFTLFSTTYGQPSCVLAARSINILSPLSLPLDSTRWLQCLLYGLAYLPRWLFQHQLPLVVLVLASDMECCTLGPPIRKFLSFSGFFGELANPLQKIDTEYKTQIGTGMVPISVPL